MWGTFTLFPSHLQTGNQPQMSISPSGLTAKLTCANGPSSQPTTHLIHAGRWRQVQRSVRPQRMKPYATATAPLYHTHYSNPYQTDLTRNSDCNSKAQRLPTAQMLCQQRTYACGLTAKLTCANGPSNRTTTHLTHAGRWRQVQRSVRLLAAEAIRHPGLRVG
jgi:hypothetical protein